MVNDEDIVWILGERADDRFKIDEKTVTDKETGETSIEYTINFNGKSKKSSFKNLTGQTLHAKTIGFIHPSTGEYIEFHAPLPEYFEKLLSQLKIKQ